MNRQGQQISQSRVTKALPPPPVPLKTHSPARSQVARPPSQASAVSAPQPSSTSSASLTSKTSSAPSIQVSQGRPDTDDEAYVYEVVWRDGRKLPGIAETYIQTLYGRELAKMPLDNAKKQFYPAPIGVNEVVLRLYEEGLVLKERKLKEVKRRVGEFYNSHVCLVTVVCSELKCSTIDRYKGECCEKLGGFIWLPKITYDASGRPVVAAKDSRDATSGNPQSKEEKGPSEFWYISSKEDRNYFDSYHNERRARMGFSEPRKQP